MRFLDGIGLLSPRLTLAHCAWARPDELALLAERGATIAVNTSSNLGLKSGIAPVPEMLRQGCRVAMGLDGMAFDEDDDALREMRLAYAAASRLGLRHDDDARAALGLRGAQRPAQRARAAAPPGGRIAPGAARRHRRARLGRARRRHALFADIDPLDLLLARANGTHIAQVIVGGRTVVEAGRVHGIDEAALRAELLARTRAALARRTAGHAAGAPPCARWREDLAPFYRDGRFGCC